MLLDTLLRVKQSKYLIAVTKEEPIVDAKHAQTDKRGAELLQ